VRSNGKQGDDISGRFSAPAVNADGLVVAFDSVATNLVGGDTNGADDIFVRGRATARARARSGSASAARAGRETATASGRT
jgi:hypothetical protein